jgi:hypothetical protein
MDVRNTGTENVSADQTNAAKTSTPTTTGNQAVQTTAAGSRNSKQNAATMSPPGKTGHEQSGSDKSDGR